MALAQTAPRPLAIAAGVVGAKLGVSACYEDGKWQGPTPDPNVSVTKLIGKGPVQATDPAAALQDVLARYSETGQPGQFEVVRAGQGWSIVPAGGSPLDTRILFPAEKRSFAETVRVILAEVQRGSKVHIESGTQGLPNGIRDSTATIGAENETAREVLMKLLAATGPGTPYWSLNYSPGKVYSMGWGMAVIRTLPVKNLQ